MTDIIPNLQLDAANPEERIGKLKFLLSEGLESLDNGSALECAYCIRSAEKCIQLVLGDMEDSELDNGSPMNAEGTVLWLYSKLVQANIPFEGIEREAIDTYFRSVEPAGDQS